MEIIAPVSINAEASWGTRASAGRYIDRDGIVQTAAANALRVTYDADDLTAAPYPLIEAQATNLALYSEQFDNAAWVKSGGYAVTANAAIAPDGTMTADYLNAASPASAYVAQSVTAAVGENTFSVWLRADADATATITLGGEPRACAVTTAWKRFSVSRTIVGGSVPFTIGGAKLYAWGAQVESGPVATSYIPTTSAAVTRAADVLSSSYGLLWSNLTENDADDAPLWIAGVAVAKDEYRRRTETHKVYKALQAVPESVTAAPELNPLDASGNPYWLEWGPTNRWGVLDQDLDTQSFGDDVLQWVVRPGELVNTLTVHASDSSDVRVSMVAASGRVVYRQTKRMILKTSRSWSDWFFKTRERRPDEVFRGMPYLKTALICVTITKRGSVTSAGAIKMGRIEDIGETLVEPEIRTLRNSLIKNDGFGRWKFNKRPSNKIMSANVYIPAARLDAVVRLVDRHTAEPCVIIGDDRWSSLILLGYFDDFAVVLNDGNSANYNLKAIGLA